MTPLVTSAERRLRAAASYDRLIAHWRAMQECRCGKARVNVIHDDPATRWLDAYHQWNPDVPYHPFEARFPVHREETGRS